MADLVQRPSPALLIRTHGFEPWLSQSNDLNVNTRLILARRSALRAPDNDYLCSALEDCECVGLSGPGPGGLVSQLGSTMHVDWHNLVPVLLRPSMLLG